MSFYLRHYFSQEMLNRKKRRRATSKMFELTALKSRIIPVVVLGALSLQLVPPVAAQDSKPAGTLLLPLTPKIDTAADEVGPIQSPTGSSEDKQASADNTVDKPNVPIQLQKLKPKADSFNVEIEVDEAAGAADQDSQGLASQIDENTTLKGTIQIVADDTEYDSENNTFLGTGNAVCIIGGQNSKLEADMILYDQKSETIDARGHVTIIRDGQVTTGKAFKFQVGKDEYLITKPDTLINGATIIARTGHGTSAGLAFKQGTLQMPEPFFFSKNQFFGPVGYFDESFKKKAHPEAYIPANPNFKFKARKIVYEKYKEEGNLTIFGGKVMIGKFGIPLGKMIATITKEGNNLIMPVTPTIGNNMQIGGTHIGPRFTHLMGKTGTIAWSPMLQFGGRTLNGSATDSSMGLSGQATISTPRLQANIAAGSVNKLLVADLNYRVNKTMMFQSGINRFQDDGMFGYRRARLNAELVDRRIITKVPFLNFMGFRSSLGAAQDNPQLVNLSPEYAQLFGGTQTSTVQNSAFKLQEQITAMSHPLFNVGNDKYGVKSYLYGGLALRGYSTGEASAIGQIGPMLDVRLNRVRFQAGYNQSAVRGSSPFLFDQFIQGNRSVNLAGDVKVSKFVTLGAGLGYNLSNKLAYSKSITAAIGPDDFKVLLSREMVRGINRVGFDVLYGGATPFRSLVLKQGADHGNLGGI